MGQRDCKQITCSAIPKAIGSGARALGLEGWGEAFGFKAVTSMDSPLSLPASA